MLKNIKLSTRIIGLVGLLLVMLTTTSLFALRQIHHIELEIDEIAQDDLPLMRVVSRLTKYKLEQATRLASLIQFAYLKRQDKLEIENRNFKDAGKRVNDVIREGRKLAKHGLSLATTPEGIKSFETIDGVLGMIEKEHAAYEQHAELLLQKIAGSDSQLQKDKEELATAVDKLEEDTAHLEEKLDRIAELIDNLAKTLVQDAHATTKTSYQILIPLTVLSIGGGLLLSILIVNNIVRTLRRTMSDLTTGSNEIAAASHQIASASQQLTVQASSQAASLEETSASLTQIASYAKVNQRIVASSHALFAEAQDTIQSTKQLLARSQQASQKLQAGLGEQLPGELAAMREYLLQLNMLATQATVEASRNDATAGYGVITAEMKQFAGRCLDLIQQAQQQSHEAIKELTQDQQVRSAATRQFADISQSSSSLKEHLDQLNLKAADYAITVGELDQAMGQLADSVQVYAATSEESAAASEELNAQAASMADTVAEIALLLGGKTKEKGAKQTYSK